MVHEGQYTNLFDHWADYYESLRNYDDFQNARTYLGLIALIQGQ